MLRSSTVQLQQMKIPAGLFYIMSDLLAQCVYGWEFDFIAHTFEKVYFHFRLRTQFKGMEVQQMRFYGKRFHFERWAISHIRHRIKTFLRYPCARDVNPIFRNQLLVAAEIDGGNCVF